MNGAFSKKSASRFLPRVAVSKRAFTIVELIIVITVIGILTAIVTISYDAVLTNSREESMKAQRSTMCRVPMDYLFALPLAVLTQQKPFRWIKRVP